MRISQLTALVVLGMTGLVASATSANAAVIYQETDLGAGVPLGINDAGVVVGYVPHGGGNPLGSSSAFIWTQTTGMQQLGSLVTGGSSLAYATNTLGQVVGVASDQNGDERAVLWDSSGIPQNLGVLGTAGGNFSAAYSINSTGQIVGNSSPPTAVGGFVAYSWTSQNGMVPLPEPSVHSEALDINDAGTIVGEVGSSPAIWQSATSAPQLIPLLPNSNAGVAFAINDQNVVAGTGTNGACGGGDEGFVWSQAVGLIDLGCVYTGSTPPIGLNNLDQVVGTILTGGQYSEGGFVWDSTNGMQNLNSMLATGSQWYVVNATVINNNGDIVGFGTNGTVGHAILLTPCDTCTVGNTNQVPEPSSALILLPGLACIFLFGFGSKMPFTFMHRI